MSTTAIAQASNAYHTIPAMVVPPKTAESSSMWKPEELEPIDTYMQSAEASTSKPQGAKSGKFGDFDMEEFRNQIRGKLLESIGASKEKVGDIIPEEEWIDPMMYAVEDEEVAAEVPEYWNAENTSQRIVDFAMSFRSLAPELEDKEYLEQMRNAVLEGFKMAKDDLGKLPGPVGKLFNDTYELTMKKFEELSAPATTAQ